MKAKFANEGLDWRDGPFRKVTDKTLAGVMVAVTNKYPTGAVIAKFYMPERGSTVYCALWVGDRRGWGSAGGWGYHKQSAALSEAIRRAGIELYGNPYGRGGDEKFSPNKQCHIDGRGHGSMVDAIQAITRAHTGERKVRVIDL